MDVMNPHFAPDSRGTSADGDAQEVLESLLHYAVRAPSGHNTQPWRFQITEGRLHLYADRSRALPVVDPENRELVMSCGAALAHLTVAMRHFGHAGDVVTLPDPTDPDLLATVGLGQAHTPRPGDHQLFRAIDMRHTHRADFETRPVRHQTLAQLERDAHRAGAAVHTVTDNETRQRIAALVGEGDRTQFDDAAFRHELATWIRPNRTRRPDGMPGYAFGISDLASVLGPTMIATFDTGASQARKDEQLALTAPALMVLSTAGDGPGDWLTAGRALAVLLLRAAALGLSASFLNQPIEVPALRRQLRDLIGGSDSPQLLLRIGYATPDRATPRRAVAAVLSASTTSTRTPS